MIDPTQAPAGQPAPAPQQGTVCIAPLGDGTFTVYLEGVAEQDAEPTDLETALEQARQLLAGAAQGAPSSAEAEAEALFTGEFDKTSGRAPLTKG